MAFGDQLGVRRRVTPANPNSAAHQLGRAALTLVTGSWKTLVAKVKTSWGTAASSAGYSGFNLFSSANIKDEINADWQHYTPINAPRSPVETVAAAQGAGTGEIDVTWALGSATGGDTMHIAYREPGKSAVTVATDSGTLASALSYTISGLASNTSYIVYVTNRDSNDKFAPSSYATATSGI